MYNIIMCSYWREVILFIFFTASSTQNCILPLVIPCNQTQSICAGATNITSLPGTSYNCPNSLQLMANYFFIEGSFSGLMLTGATIQIQNMNVQTNLNINTSLVLTIIGSIQIIGSLLINSNQTNISNTSIFVVNATIVAKKVVMIGVSTVEMSSTTITTTAGLCLYESININQISQNMSVLIGNMDVQTISNFNFTLFIMAYQSIVLNNSNILAVSFALISQANASFTNSVLNTSGSSCRTNSGLGRGSVIQYQNTYCTSGSSSCGYGSISNFQLCFDIIQYFLFLSHSFPYISKGPFLSTGSGGFGYNLNGSGRGSGGGIVFILAEDTLILNGSQILANGGDVYINDTISAGSGGTIFIFSKNLTGVEPNNISAAGGNSFGNNGAGGGGLVKISYATVTQTIDSYSLWVNIDQGYQPDSTNQAFFNGIFYGPLCPGGSQAYYLGCKICSPDSYSTLGDPVCRSCPTSDQYESESTISGKSSLSQCFWIKKESSLVQWFTPGDISILTIGLYLVSLVIFTVIGAVLKKHIKKQKLSSGEQFRVEDVQRDIEKAKIIALELRKSKTIKSQQLMYHVHRISCFGNNTEDSPWVLPSIVPIEVRKYVLPQAFVNFSQSFNKMARWDKFEYWTTKLSILIYPLFWFYLDRIKKQKYIKLQTMLQNAKDYNLINNYDYEDRTIVTIKFSKNKDYTNCYLDFFVYDRADTKYFTLSSPFILYLSGEGNFLRPFYLQEGDIFFRMMFFVINRDLVKLLDIGDEKKQLFSNMISQKKRQKNCVQLATFMRKFNTIACTLDLSAPSSNIAAVLWSLVQLIQKWNQQFFNKVAVQIEIILMTSHLIKKDDLDNQVHILTKGEKQSFTVFILNKLKQIGEWQESSVKIGLLVYNPEQQIPIQQEIIIKKGQSNQFQMQQSDESIKESLLYSHTSMNVQRRIRNNSIISIIQQISHRIRYYMISHRSNGNDEYTIKFLQSLFILMQALLMFIWSIKLQIPYLFVNLVYPFIGIIWFVSDSYGFGKLYLILNAMSMVNEIVTVITYSLIESSKGQTFWVERNLICSGINIIIIILMMFVGTRAITHSKKLSLKKEDQSQKVGSE